MKRFFDAIKSPVFIGALLVFNVPAFLNSKSFEPLCFHTNTKHSLIVFPSPLKKKLLHASNQNIIAAALAFPFPFGCVGLHRVYLGTAPHVPIVYAATAGGVFGILPLIDCIILLSKKNISDFQNNNAVIMWIKNTDTIDSLSLNRK